MAKDVKSNWDRVRHQVAMCVLSVPPGYNTFKEWTEAGSPGLKEMLKHPKTGHIKIYMNCAACLAGVTLAWEAVHPRHHDANNPPNIAHKCTNCGRVLDSSTLNYDRVA